MRCKKSELDISRAILRAGGSLSDVLSREDMYLGGGSGGGENGCWEVATASIDLMSKVGT
jgi:hypothetical protein